MPETFDVRKFPTSSAATIAAVKKALGIAPSAPAGARAELLEAAKAVKPGKERWPVKTGSDDDTAKVKQEIVPATVEELIRAKRPAAMKNPAELNKDFQSKRAAPVETTIFRVEASIVGIKFEDDGDYHVILQGASGEFLVAEAPTPDPPFVKETSPFRENIKQTRAALDKKFFKQMQAMQFLAMGNVMMPMEAFSSVPEGVRPMDFASSSGRAAALAAPVKMKIKPTKVSITGVGFFDRTHGQTGGAPNGIELHPILSVKFL